MICYCLFTNVNANFRMCAYFYKCGFSNVEIAGLTTFDKCRGGMPVCGNGKRALRLLIWNVSHDRSVLSDFDFLLKSRQSAEPCFVTVLEDVPSARLFHLCCPFRFVGVFLPSF